MHKAGRVLGAAAVIVLVPGSLLAAAAYGARNAISRYGIRRSLGRLASQAVESRAKRGFWNDRYRRS